MRGFDISSILGGQVVTGGSRRNIQEIFFRKTVWPQYVVILKDLALHYSSGSMVYANHTNYAYLTATYIEISGGHETEPVTVTLTPSSSDTLARYFDISADGHITPKASYDKTDRNDILCTFTGTYNGHGISEGTASVSVALQYNHAGGKVYGGYGVDVSCYPSYFSDCRGGNTSISLSLSRSWTRTWTSAATESGSDPVTASAAVSYNGHTYTIASGSSVTAATPNNQHNKNNLETYATCTYQGVTGSGSTFVRYDGYSDVTTNINYWASLAKSSDTVSASGGSCRLSASAGHTRRVTTTWESDHTTSYEDTPVTDSATITEKAGSPLQGFTRSGSLVSHRNMTVNETTDVATYECYNTSDISARSAEVSFSVQNVKTQVAGETTTAYGSITVSPSSLGSAGGTISISGGTRTYTTAKYEYTSGSTEGGTTSYQYNVLPDHIQIDGVSYAGSSHAVGINLTTSSVSHSVIGILDGFSSAAKSVSQAANSYVWEGSLGMPTFAAYTIPAGGGTASHPSGTASHRWRWATTPSGSWDGTENVSLSWNKNTISASPRTNVVGPELTIDTFVGTASHQGASGSTSQTVKQQANALISEGPWVYTTLLRTSHSSAIDKKGEMVEITLVTSRQDRTNIYTAGPYPDPAAGDIATRIDTTLGELDIVGAVTAGTTFHLTLDANITGEPRTAVVSTRISPLMALSFTQEAITSFDEYITRRIDYARGEVVFHNSFTQRLYFTYRVTDSSTGWTTGDQRTYIVADGDFYVLVRDYNPYTSIVSAVVSNVSLTQ